MSIYVEFDAMGQAPFILLMPNDNIRQVKRDMKDGGAVLGRDIDKTEVYVFDSHLITMMQVDAPKSWLKREKSEVKKEAKPSKAGKTPDGVKIAVEPKGESGHPETGDMP